MLPESLSVRERERGKKILLALIIRRIVGERAALGQHKTKKRGGGGREMQFIMRHAAALREYLFNCFLLPFAGRALFS